MRFVKIPAIFSTLTNLGCIRSSGVRKKFSWGGFHSAKIFLCTKIESMIRKNIKQAAIQYVNVVKQL